jgi:hypothetical protein
LLIKLFAKSGAKVRIYFRKTKPAHSFFLLVERFSFDLAGQSTKKPHHDPSSGGDAVQNAYI